MRPLIKFPERNNLSEYSQPIDNYNNNVSLIEIYFANKLISFFPEDIRLEKRIDPEYWEPFFSSFGYSFNLIPNFIIENKDYCIVIEIEELINRNNKPKKFITNGIEKNRFEVYNDFNIIYISFFENQILDNPLSCCKKIAECIKKVNDNYQIPPKLRNCESTKNLIIKENNTKDKYKTFTERLSKKIETDVIFVTKSKSNKHRIYGNLNFDYVIDINDKYKDIPTGNCFRIKFSEEKINISNHKLYSQNDKLKDEFKYLSTREKKELFKKLNTSSHSMKKYYQEKFFEVEKVEYGSEKIILIE